MQYLLLIYQAEEIWENMSAQEQQSVLAKHGKLQERMRQEKVEWTGHPLMPTSTAVSVRGGEGNQVVSDGPFAETKEQLAGFYLVDVADLEQAMSIARELQITAAGTIEVRPLADHSEHVPD